MRGLERWIRRTFDKAKQLIFKNVVSCTYLMLILLLGIIAVPRIFAEQQAIRSIEVFSEKLNYMNKEPGSWKVTKSAKWISKGTTEITFDVDTIAKIKNKYKDILFVLDVSGSMNGDKLDRVKADTIELVTNLLSDDKNRAGLITFDSNSEIILPFTNNKDELIEKINNLTATGFTNYYQALVNIDTILKDYVKEKDKECIVLFLTDGYPNEDTPNEEGQYSYLKSQYPFININGVQYEMGSSVLEPIKKVSDNQYIADMETLNNVLFEASIIPITYENFEITDYIDTKYFYVQEESDIKVSQGVVTFDKDNQKFTWKMNNLKSGQKAKMIIKSKLKDELIGEGGFYSTNLKEEIKSKIDESEEDITSLKTPILKDNYKVIYDGNEPDGCKVNGVPVEKQYSVFDTVVISDSVPKCEGYKFKGWDIVTKNANKVNGDYFVMPEKDVIIKAVWSKLDVVKSLDGEIYEYAPTLERVTYYTRHYSDSFDTIDEINYQSQLHKYQSSLEKIIIQNEMNPMNNAIDILDLSEDKSKSILAYIVPNESDSSMYTAYIQCDGSIVANRDSSHLFAGFSSLKSIEGLENLNTSKVTNMTNMFGSKNIENLDISSFDTSRVTNMSFMFASVVGFNYNYEYDYYIDISNLNSLNMGHLDTSKVNNMKGMFAGTILTNEQINLIFSELDMSRVKDTSFMFYNSRGLTSLDLRELDTSKVTNMKAMFAYSSLIDVNFSNLNTSSVVYASKMFESVNDLINADLGEFNASHVVDMSRMFYLCGKLTSANLSDLDTSSLIDLNNIFYYCSSLVSLNLNNFNTSNVTNMGGMFDNCSSLTNLDVSSFNTSKVTDMGGMFNNCSSLTNLDLRSFETSNVTDMEFMFSGCDDLINLDISTFDTSSVIRMRRIFAGCSSLTSLNLSSFDTSNVWTMEEMFRWCSNLISLDLSNFNTSKVEKMDDMFSDCSSLKTLDLISFDTTGVWDFRDMFKNCSSLVNLNLSSFDTTSATDMRSMFEGCKSLTSLNVSSFNTSNIIYISRMFYECSSLINLDLSVFNTEQVSDMSYMFYGCSSLASLDVSSFDTSKVTGMHYMFSGCCNLTSLDLSNFDTSKVTDIRYFFNACNKLNTTITLSSSNFNSYEMFLEAATEEGAQIIVNYTADASSRIDAAIATKSENSNVIKGTMVTT